MTTPTKEDCFFEVKEIEYDKNELVKIYEQVKQYQRVKRRNGYVYPPGFVSKTRVIQYDDHNIPNVEDHGKSVNFLDFDYIRNLLQKFKFRSTLHPAQVTMISYAEGFNFPPHVDGIPATSVIMIPFIVPPTPIKLDFYHEEGIEYVPFANYVDMEDSKIFYTHTYSEINPTIINGTMIHGIKETTGFNVRLKINIEELFPEIRTRYNNGTLVSVA